MPNMTAKGNDCEKVSPDACGLHFTRSIVQVVGETIEEETCCGYTGSGVVGRATVHEEGCFFG